MTNNLPADREKFLRDGYVAIRPLFSPEQVDDITNNVKRYIRDIIPHMPATQVYYEDKSNPSSLKQIQQMFLYDDWFAKLMNSSVISDIAAYLLQDDLEPVNLQYFNKPAGMNQATPPHQDGYYFHLTPCEAVTGWLALDDVDDENGCVQYVRGSHRQNKLRPHGYTNVIGFSQGITDFGSKHDIKNSVAMHGQAGTFLMHHAKTIHFAGANISADRPRRALGFIYYAKRAEKDLRASEAYQRQLNERLKSSGKI